MLNEIHKMISFKVAGGRTCSLTEGSIILEKTKECKSKKEEGGRREGN